jgi:hypothetical protein
MGACHIIGSLIGEEVPQQMAAEPRNDGSPILRLLFDIIQQMRVYLITD